MIILAGAKAAGWAGIKQTFCIEDAVSWKYRQKKRTACTFQMLSYPAIPGSRYRISCAAGDRSGSHFVCQCQRTGHLCTDSGTVKAYPLLAIKFHDYSLRCVFYQEHFRKENYLFGFFVETWRFSAKFRKKPQMLKAKLFQLLSARFCNDNHCRIQSTPRANEIIFFLTIFYIYVTL